VISRVRSGGGSRRRPWRLLLAGYALLGLAWVFGNPPGAVPDEPANYVKALGVAGGEWLGTPRRLPPGMAAFYRLDGPRYAFASATTTWVDVPIRLLMPNLACDAFDPTRSAECLNAAAPDVATSEQPTYVGTYPPFAYLLAAPIAWVAPNALSSFLLMRLGFLLISLVLLALAAATLEGSDAQSLSLIGLLVGVTPCVLFISAGISANGVEICGGLCFFSAILVILRGEPEVRRLVWIALAAGGLALVLSRPLGLLWIVGSALLLTHAPAAFMTALCRTGRVAVVSLGAIGVGSVVALSWALLVGSDVHASVGSMLAVLPAALALLPENGREAIGVFGWLDTRMPESVYAVYTLAVLCLAGLALVIGDWRQRRTLIVLVLATVGLSVVIGAGLLLPSGFALQGRYILPFAVCIPLFAGEVVWQQRKCLPPLWRLRLLGGSAIVVGLLQCVCWYLNARRYAVGSQGPIGFISHSEWSPVLGWGPWLAVALAGTVMVVALGLPGEARTDVSKRRLAA